MLLLSKHSFRVPPSLVNIMSIYLIVFFGCFAPTILFAKTTARPPSHPPPCDLVSSDRSKCYFYRNKTLTFADSMSYCKEILDARLPTEFNPDDESRIITDLGLSFWRRVKFRFHYDERMNRVNLMPHNHLFGSSNKNSTEILWDFTAINFTIFWADDLYCAQASDARNKPRGKIVWAPKDCNQTADAVLCEKAFISTTTTTTVSQTTTTARSVVSSQIPDVYDSSNSDRSNASERVVAWGMTDPETSRQDEAFIRSAILIFTFSSHFRTILGTELLVALLTALLMSLLLLIVRHILRRTRHRFTVSGIALVYVKSDLPESEFQTSPCTSFTMKGFE